MSTTKTHTAIATLRPGQFSAIQVPTPTPGPGEVLVKVSYASMIAFDTYVNDLGYYVKEEDFPVIFGFNAAGVIEEVGAGVDDLKVGDRVTAFTFGPSKRKGMQQYMVQPRVVCAKIPDTLPLDAASTIPDNFITAFNTLFSPIYFALPIPSFGVDSSSTSTTDTVPPKTTPILIYGAGSTTGQYAIQLLHAAGYTNVLATASPKHHEYLKSLGAKHVFDYRGDVSSLAFQILSVTQGTKIDYVLDCVTAQGTLARIAQIVNPNGGKVALLLPIKEGDSVRGVGGKDNMVFELPEDQNPLPKGVKELGVRNFLYLENSYLKENLMPKILPHLLESGTIQPNRMRLLDQSFGSLEERVGTGLDLLRNNKVSGEKVVVKID